MPGYRPSSGNFSYISQWGFVWTREQRDNLKSYCLNLICKGIRGTAGVNMRNEMQKTDAHVIRCIQELP